MSLISDREILNFVQNIGNDRYVLNHKFGSNDSVGTSFEDVWQQGGNLSYLTSAETMSVVSDSIEDDVGLTGATGITVQGLDNNWLPISEDIIMDGTTPVVTTNSFIRVHRAFITTVGTAETNVGNITITASTAATVQAKITATVGQTLKSQVSIPANCNAILLDWTVSCGKNDDFEVRLCSREFNKGVRVRDVLFVYQSEAGHVFNGAIILPEKSDIMVQAKSGTAGRPIHADYTYIIYPKNIP